MCMNLIILGPVEMSKPRIEHLLRYTETFVFRTEQTAAKAERGCWAVG